MLTTFAEDYPAHEPKHGLLQQYAFGETGCAAWNACDDYAWAAYSVLPLQTECGHLQSRSGMSSIVSHCGLQYSSEVT